MYKYALLCLTLCFLALAGCGDTGEDGPDLVVSDLAVTSWTADSITYSFTITNNGNEAVNLDGPTGVDYDNVSVQAFLSADTVFNNSGDIAAGGTIVGLSPLGDLDPGESLTGTFGASAVVDTSATPYLVLMVDWGDVVEETNESNNTLAVSIEDLGEPDLVIADLVVTSWGSDRISYSFTIANNGDGDANLDGPTDNEYDNVSVQAFLSADTVLDEGTDIPAGGTVLGLSPLGDLAPGETFDGSFGASAVVDPVTTPYLILKVDWGNVVDESNEANNTEYTEIPELDEPDLVVTSLEITSWSATTIAYSYTITNVGDADAVLEGPTEASTDNVSVQAYVSSDTVFGDTDDIAAGGTVVGYSPLANLAPGESLSGTFASATTIDTSTPQYLVLKVDWGDVVDESNETNNTLAIEIGQTGTPDLVVSALEITSWTDTSIQYSYTITNNGDGPANLDGPTDAGSDNVSVQAFLSSDVVFNNAGDIAAGGTIVGLSPLGNLDPGESMSGTFGASATVDPIATPYLILKVDWGGVVDESDEDNNTLETQFPGKPDLIVTDLEVTSWTATTIQYSYTIENIGGSAANLDGPTNADYDNVKVQAFLSADTVFNNSDDIAAGGTVLGMSPLGYLAPGGTFSGTFGSSVTVNPDNTPYLVLKVDWGGVVDEADETNNTYSALIE